MNNFDRIRIISNQKKTNRNGLQAKYGSLPLVKHFFCSISDKFQLNTFDRIRIISNQKKKTNRNGLQAKYGGLSLVKHFFSFISDKAFNVKNKTKSIQNQKIIKIYDNL